MLAGLGDPGPILHDADVSYAEVMAGSGTPIPWLGKDGQYMQMVFHNYLQPSFGSLHAPQTPASTAATSTPWSPRRGCIR